MTRYNIGDRIQNRYEIYKIFEGGFGVVYICYDHEEHVPLAIKGLREDYASNERVIQRFRQGVLEWVELERHQNIVRAYYVDVIEERPYIFLEYIAGAEGVGSNLADWIWRGRVDYKQALKFAVHIANGMDYVYRKRKLVHRDLKPQNILVTSDGIAKVTDFLLAKSMIEDGKRKEKSISVDGSSCGTPPYMPPEQWGNAENADTRADIYGFGCVLYEMLIGESPFGVRGTLEEFRRAHLHELPKNPKAKNPSVSDNLNKLVMKCLEKEPQKRYENFAYLREELVGIYRREIGEEISLEVEPSHLEAWELNNKGFALNNLGRHQEAIVCYDKALGIDERLAEAWYNKTPVLYNFGLPPSDIAREKLLETRESLLVKSWNPGETWVETRKRLLLIDSREAQESDKMLESTQYPLEEIQPIQETPANLVIVTGKDSGRYYAIKGASMRIGRSGDCDIVINNPAVSSAHAQILLEEERFLIRDLGSKNGTFVNGERVTHRVVLADGDIIRVGRTELEFRQILGIEVQQERENRIQQFEAKWEDALGLTLDDDGFRECASDITDIFCDALGFKRLDNGEKRRHLLSFQVEAPILRLRIPSKFPIVFLQSKQPTKDDIDELYGLLDALGVLHRFAILVSPNNVGDVRRRISGMLGSYCDLVVLGNEEIRAVLLARNHHIALTKEILKQIDLIAVSPFQISGPVPENMFFGRESEIKTIVQTIRFNSIAIVGGRRIGKTSTLQKIWRMFSQDPSGYVPKYLNCQEATNYPAFFDLINIHSDEWNLKEQVTEENPVSFRRVIASLEAEQPDKIIVVLMDEVDELLNYDVANGEKLFKSFRALSEEGKCRFIFSGERVLYNQLHNSSSPLFNFCKTLVLRYLEQKDARKIIIDPLTLMSIEIAEQDAVVNEILKIVHIIAHGEQDASGQPYLILANKNNKGECVYWPELALVLKKGILNLVVLSACLTNFTRNPYADIIASLARTAEVPAIVAMKFVIATETAEKFAETFYWSLAESLPVDTALTRACRRIYFALENKIEWATPMLVMTSHNGTLFDLPFGDKLRNLDELLEKLKELYKRACQAQKRGDWREAIRLFQNIETEYEGFKDVEERLKQNIGCYKDEVVSRFERHLEQRDWDAAERLCHELAEIDSVTAHTLMNCLMEAMGMVFIEAGEFVRGLMIQLRWINSKMVKVPTASLIW